MSRSQLLHLIDQVSPLDSLEAEHRAAAIEWIQSGAELYRTVKPATPPQHLVSYFLPVDPDASAALLVDHKAAALWLPPGGHVEPDEDPAEAVRRELREELGWEADFLCTQPLFITLNRVSDSAGGHCDVSLWYALRSEQGSAMTLDPGEHYRAAWFPLDDFPYGRSDPHLRRFVGKLQGLLGVAKLLAVGNSTTESKSKARAALAP